MRARLAIASSAQTCELREITLKDKPQALIDASPKATVPVLVDLGGRVIDQSLDIMLWALRRNDPASWLRPELGSFDEMIALIGECDGAFKHHLDRYKYPNRYQDAVAASHRDAAGLWLALLDARLARTGYLSGSRPALTDMAIAPFVRQYAHTDFDWFQAQPWSALQAWLESWKTSAQFKAVMRKFPVWIPGAPGERFPAP
jgi:glutathione S-transferase